MSAYVERLNTSSTLQVHVRSITSCTLFWFRFVYPEMEEIEKRKGSVVIESIKPQFNRYVGRHFVNISREILDMLNDKGVLPFRFTRIGKW